MENIQPEKDELEKINIENLQWIESQTLQLMGIDIFKVFSYELIQVLNHQWLKEKLSNEIT